MSDTELVPAATRIRRGAVKLARRLRSARTENGLSAGKLGILGHLHHHGPSTLGEIASAEQHKPQSLTRLVAELAQAGLISLAPGRSDRRQSVATLAPSGREVLVRDAHRIDHRIARALTGFSPTERQVLDLAAPLMERLALALAQPDAEPGQ